MRSLVLCCTLALAACASGPPRCGNRLTPINRQSIRAADVPRGRRPAAHPAKAVGL